MAPYETNRNVLPNVTDLAGPTVESSNSLIEHDDYHVQGYYEPGNGTSYALAALRLTPGEWPGTRRLALPVLVSWEGSGAWAFDLSENEVLHANYVRDKLGGSVCDASAIVRWLEGFPGANFTPVVTCSCGRNGHDA